MKPDERLLTGFFYSECRTLCPDLKAQLVHVHEAFADSKPMEEVS